MDNEERYNEAKSLDPMGFSEKGLHQLVEAQVARTPEAMAVICGETVLTYGDLDLQATRLARQLHGFGLGPEKVAGVYMERSPTAVVALLAVLKAGGAFVPMESRWPARRLASLVKDSGMAMLLTQRSLLERLPPEVSELSLCVEDMAAGDLGSGFPADDVVVIPESLAYVVYTSGSTGNPKGVMVEHAQIARHCWRMADYYGLSPADRMLQFSPFGFDVAIENLLALPGFVWVNARLGRDPALRNGKGWPFGSFSCSGSQRPSS